MRSTSVNGKAIALSNRQKRRNQQAKQRWLRQKKRILRACRRALMRNYGVNMGRQRAGQRAVTEEILKVRPELSEQKGVTVWLGFLMLEGFDPATHGGQRIVTRR